MKRNKRKNKGITLIALVITIIILLILAGVAIYALNSENGILSKSKLAKEENQKVSAKEMINLKITDCQVGIYSEKQRVANLTELAKYLNKDEDIQYVELKSQKVAVLDETALDSATSIYTKLNKYPYEFEIRSDLTIASIDGIKIAEQYSSKTGGFGQSDIINEFNCKIKKISTTKVIVEVDGDVTTTDNTSIIGYIVFLRGEPIGVTESKEYTIKSLERNTDYNSIYMMAIDKKMGTKKSANELNAKTLDLTEEVLNYPIFTKNGMCNVKFIDPDNSANYYYDFDPDMDCTAADALSKAAYDRDATTALNKSTGKVKFYFGTDIDIWYVCFKIPSFTGHLIDGVRVNGFAGTGDVAKLPNGDFHPTWWGKNSTAWKGELAAIGENIYEIYYDPNIN